MSTGSGPGSGASRGYVHSMTTQVVPARVQIKTKELRESGAEMGLTVCVYGQRTDRRDTLPDDAFQCGSDFAPQQR